MFQEGNVVQFNEKHKWCGAIGIVDEAKQLTNDVKYLVGVQIPMQGIAYIFVLESENALEYIGEAVLIPETEDEQSDTDH